MYVKLKKKFGQNFLIDKNITNKIADLIDSSNLNILEIGPGDGRLTKKIIEKKPKELDIVEVDRDLIEILEINFKKYRFINIFNEDILKMNTNNHYDLIISNLPYNLSSKILEKIILLKNNPKTLILMFQKEFAERLLSNKLNSINSLIKCFYDIRLEFHVSKNCFRPIPKIESTVLKFEKLRRGLIKNNEIKRFIKFKRYIFSYKRKSLRKILKDFEFNDQTKLDLRVEKLKLIELVNIFRQIKF
tara:strand:+ start:269 stop:1006 length:738 start_codon:yes stop_codon:yes gene_type:complete